MKNTVNHTQTYSHDLLKHTHTHTGNINEGISSVGLIPCRTFSGDGFEVSSEVLVSCGHPEGQQHDVRGGHQGDGGGQLLTQPGETHTGQYSEAAVITDDGQ